jgi:hemerythrin-like metal-binding protein
MAKRTQWIPHFNTGNAAIDEQHQGLLAQCNALADCLAETDAAGDEKFSNVLDKLMAGVRAHFATEQEQLARNGYPQLEDHAHEGEEFEYLSSEIISTENFDKDELQTFLALWCIGHIAGTVEQQRPYLAQQLSA